MNGEYADTASGRLHYRHVGAGQATDATPLILIHGGQMDSSFWMRLAPRLARRRWVIAPDIPPYGLSEMQAQEPARLAEFAQPVVALMDALGIDRASIGGFHIGASVAAEVAASHPERVDRLILMGPSATETQADRDAMYEKLGFQFDDAAVADPVRLVRDFEAKVARPEDPDWYTAHLIGRLLAGARSWWIYRALFRYDVAARMDLIGAPTLAIHFERDVLPLEIARNTLNHIRHATWLMLEGADHYLALTDPERLAEPIEEFLTSAGI